MSKSSGREEDYGTVSILDGAMMSFYGIWHSFTWLSLVFCVIQSMSVQASPDFCMHTHDLPALNDHGGED